MAVAPPGIEKFVFSQSLDVVNCPHCGRYVGPLELCVYCRKHHKKRLSTRIIKYSSPFLAVLGILVLHQLGQVQGHPLVRVGELTPRSNFAYVRIAGTVCEAPRVYAAAGSQEADSSALEFAVDDGTGRIKVKTYEDATRRVVASGNVPVMGDKVEVLGNLQFRGSKKSLVVGAAEEIRVTGAAQAMQMDAGKLASIGEDEVASFSTVEVTGWVKALGNQRKPGSYSAYFTLRGEDRDGLEGERKSVKVSIQWKLLEADGSVKSGDGVWASAPAPGTWVTVKGAVRYDATGKYPGWTVTPGHVSDIRRLDRAPHPVIEEK
jgi:hypothetical protein